MLRKTAWALAIALAAAARAQESRPEDPGKSGAAADVAKEADEAPGTTSAAPAPTPGGAAPAAGEPSAASLADRCVALLRGDADRGGDADLAPRCEQLVRSGAAPASLEPQAGTGRDAPTAGASVLAAFSTAGRELMGGKTEGARPRAPAKFTLVTNPLGWFNGLGINAELFRSFKPKLSWVAGARYSTTDASNGSASTAGLMAGIDWYISGRNNRGLRIGPRMELAAGREEFQGNSTFARLALAGELGYNFIASNGLTALLAGGMGGRIAGDEQNADFASFAGGEFGPFLKVGLGYSW